MVATNYEDLATLTMALANRANTEQRVQVLALDDALALDGAIGIAFISPGDSPEKVENEILGAVPASRVALFSKGELESFPKPTDVELLSEEDINTLLGLC